MDTTFIASTLLKPLSLARSGGCVSRVENKFSAPKRRVKMTMGSSETPLSSGDLKGLANPFCTKCATRTEWAKPVEDERYRHVCPNCSTVMYENPKVVVGCVPVTPDGKRVLLLKRAIYPVGKWTIPAGFMELDETAHAGAAREAMEEAYAEVDLSPLSLLSVYNILPAKQIQLLFRATLLNEGTVRPGMESLEVNLFEWDNIPGEEELAFPTVSWALHYARRHVHTELLQPEIRTR